MAGVVLLSIRQCELLASIIYDGVGWVTSSFALPHQLVGLIVKWNPNAFSLNAIVGVRRRQEMIYFECLGNY